MGRAVFLLLRLKTALWINAFFYYLRRLWLIGRLVPDGILEREGLKRGLAWAALALRQVVELSCKAAYLWGFLLLPIPLLLRNGALEGRGLDLAVHIFFVLSCVGGALMESQVFSVTREKITCVTYLHMDGQAYTRAYLLLKYVPFFLWFLPALMAAMALCGGSPWQGVLLWLLLLGTRMAGEALQLRLFDRTGKVLCRNMWFEWGVILAVLVLAYLPPYLGWLWPAADVLLHPVTVLAVTVLGAACCRYLFWGYRGFSQKLHRSIDQAFLLSNALKASAATSSVAEVEIRADDLRRGSEGRFQHLEGYAYFNALFFHRHRRQLARPVCYRLAAVLVIFLAAVAMWTRDRAGAAALAADLTLILPMTVYIMYFMSVADKACHAMFYNCDVSMLRHGFYRRPAAVLSMFRQRLVRVSRYNLCVSGAVCLAAVGFCALCGVSLLQGELLLFCVSVLLLAVFFTVHHLCMYYIFQPFAADMKVKNPFYSAINGGVFALCLLCMVVDVGGVGFALLILGSTAAYTVAALALVCRLAPSRFRVK